MASWLTTLPNVEIIRGDLLDRPLLEQALEECDSVIHAASLFSMWGDAGDFVATNVRGTENIVQAALQARIKKFVYVSTVAVIGQPTPNLVVDEQHPPRPSDRYQQSKLQAEHLILRHYQDEHFPALIVRPGAFYGPGGNYAFNRLFFADPLRGLVMQMDGGHYVIFPTYISDAADGILLALEKGRTGEIYNVCGECLSHEAAFDIILRQAGIWRPRLNLPGWLGINFARFLTLLARMTRIEPFYPIGLRSYVFNDWHVSSEKAKRELGFQPIPFEEGSRRTLNWYRSGCPPITPDL
jgi:nucleoside-diphosphate-sugar epimerase